MYLLYVLYDYWMCVELVHTLLLQYIFIQKLYLTIQRLLAYIHFYNIWVTVHYIFFKIRNYVKGLWKKKMDPLLHINCKEN